MKKRIISFLLTVLMVMSLLPASVFAAAPTVSSFFEDLPISADPGTGTTAWKGSTLDGESVLMSGSKGKSRSTSTLTLTFTDDTHLTFEYKVSSEDDSDKCTIKLGDTVLVDEESGDQDWKGLEVDASSGDKLTVTYKKDSAVDKYDDCVYLRGFTAGEALIVTFHNGDDSYTQKVFGGKGTLKATAFTSTDKIFAGWATAEGGDVAYKDGAQIELTDNIDLYAVWSAAFAVTFNDGSKESVVLVPQNEAIGSRIPADPAKKGYIFGGWFCDEAQLTAETVIGADATYTAKWTPITYTIAFNANGGEGSMDSITAAYDEEVALPENAFTRAGYSFKGWGSYFGTSAVTYKGEDTVKNLASVQDATVTLYAAWKGDPVNVTLKLNYEGAEDITRTGVVGENYNYIATDTGAKLDSIKDPVRTGYIFDGWFDAAEGGNEISLSYKLTAADAENGFVMYAQWTKGITVHFDGNGYKGTIADKTVTPDKVYSSLPSYTNSYYYPTGKYLDGWYIKNADGSFGDAVTKDTVFTGDEVTLIAKWRDPQYVIKFNIKYSDKSTTTGTMADQVVPFGQDAALTKCAFSREGYEFAGWGTSSSGSTVAYVDGATINRAWDDDYWDGSEDNETFNLYAIWTEKKSPEQTAAEEKLSAADTAITGNYTPAYGTDENALTMIRAKLAAAGITDVTVTMKEAAYSSYNYVGITADGTIQYKWNENGSTPAASGTVRPVLILTCTGADGKTYTKESDECLFYIPLDEAKATEALNKVADRISVPETIESADDLTSLAKYPLKEGVDETKVDYNSSSDLELWSTATWASSDSSVISITSVDYPYFSPYKVTVSIPEKDTKVTLTLTLVYNGREDLKLVRTYTVNVKGSVQIPDFSYADLIDLVLDEVGLKNFNTGTKLDAANVTSDIQFPTTKDFARISYSHYEKSFDGKFTPILLCTDNDSVVVSADPSVANVARMVTYRPLPGKDAQTVTVTIKILDRPSGEGKDYENMTVLASKDITLTVQPFEQSELDAAAAFMKKVCTPEVYWEGIRSANKNKDNVTSNMSSFIEIVPNGDGYKFIRNQEDYNFAGVEADDIPGWYDSQIYRCFRSSVPCVISHENLLITQPKYNTEVTIDSVLTYTEYAKYYEKFGSDPAYEQFEQFYQQPVSATVTVIGTEGIPDPDTQPVAVTVNIDGSIGSKLFKSIPDAAFTAAKGDHKTAADALLEIFKQNGYTYNGTTGYISGVTDANGVALIAGDSAHGPWSGWMFTVNGEMPIKSTDPDTGNILYATLADYELKNGDVLRFYFVNCPTDDGDHIWDDGEVTLKPTYNRAGEKTYTCEVCGGTRTEEIAKLDKCSGGEICPSRVFTDVNTDGWYHEAIDFVKLRKLFNGTSDTTFAPDAPMTRGMMVTVLWRAAGCTEAKSASGFTDVADGQYYAEAVAWAKENGIVLGISSTEFAPNANVTREQLVVFMYRYAKFCGVSVESDGSLDSFKDNGSLSAYAADAMAWAVENGIITGIKEADGSYLVPQGNATRAQVAAVFMRYADNIG